MLRVPDGSSGFGQYVDYWNNSYTKGYGQIPFPHGVTWGQMNPAPGDFVYDKNPDGETLFKITEVTRDLDDSGTNPNKWFYHYTIAYTNTGRQVGYSNFYDGTRSSGPGAVRFVQPGFWDSFQSWFSA